MAQQDGQDPMYPLKKLEEFIKKKLAEIWQGVIDGLRGNRRAQNTLFGFLVGGAAYLLSKNTVGRGTEAGRQAWAKHESKSKLRTIDKKERKLSDRKFTKGKVIGKKVEFKDVPQKLCERMQEKARSHGMPYEVFAEKGKQIMSVPYSRKGQAEEIKKEAIASLVQDDIKKDFKQYQKSIENLSKISEVKDNMVFRDPDLKAERDSFIKENKKNPREHSKNYTATHSLAMSDFIKNKDTIGKELGEGIEVTVNQSTGLVDIHSTPQDIVKVSAAIQRCGVNSFELCANSPQASRDSFNCEINVDDLDSASQFLHILPSNCNYTLYQGADGKASIYTERDKFYDGMKQMGVYLRGKDQERALGELREFAVKNKESNIDPDKIHLDPNKVDDGISLEDK